VIALQRLDSASQNATRRLADEPERTKTLEARLEAARQHLATSKAQLTENQHVRRAIEKEVAVHQGRLSKFREQAMAVKTNQEYHAVQKEIGFAEGEVKSLEDKILERMLEADELTATVKRAEKELAEAHKTAEAEQRAMTSEVAELKASLERIVAERAMLVSAMDPQVLAVFDSIAKKRNGISVSEARDGICTICHVRLRPQVFNTVRRNEAIIQCDHCNRILYFVPATAPATPDSVTQPAS
jgi:predicted  nucleic acid-binding Zn-ribbon protein